MLPIDINTIAKFFQIAQPLVYGETLRLNTKMREDTAKNSLLTLQMNHEQQLKMFYLSEQYKQQEKWLDFENRKEFLHDQSALQAHSNKMASCDEYYKMGNFITERLRNKPAPLIIVSTNPYQKYNPFKNEALTIAPLNRITNTIRQLNGVYEDKKLLSITDTNEFFMSEGDVSRFFHRELNCPCIIIYANFTGESLSINSYIAGILDSQKENIDLNNEISNIDLSPKRELLWDIPYSLIHDIIARYKEIKRPLQWQSHLAELTNYLVVLHIQRYIDEYFKYYPLNIYESHTLDFITTKEEQLTKQFPDLMNIIKEHHVVRTKFQKSLWPSSNTTFEKITNINSDIINNSNNSNEFLSNNNNSIFKITYLNSTPRYLLGLTVSKNNNNKFALIDLNGTPITKHEFDDIKEAKANLIPVKKNDKWGALNTKGEEVITINFDELDSHKSGLIKFRDKSKLGILDSNGQIKLPALFDFLSIETNNSYFCDIGSKKILSGFNIRGPLCEYDEINKANRSFYVYQKLYSFKNDTLNDIKKFFGSSDIDEDHMQYGFYDAETDRVLANFATLPEQTDLIQSFDYIIDFGNNYYELLIVNNKRFKEIENGNFILNYKTTIKFALFATQGEEISEEECLNFLLSLKEGEFIINQTTLEQKNKISKLKTDFNIISSKPFTEGFSVIKTKKGLYGYLNLKIEIAIVPSFQNARPFKDGIAAVKQNELWGFINFKGIFIFAPQFSEVTDFNENRAFVKFPSFAKEEWAIIDNLGNILTEIN